MGKNVLLEIGTEEIPTSYLEPAQEQLRALAEQSFAAHRLAFKTITTYATPRRLALTVENLDEKSSDRVEEILGPSVRVGCDAQGNFTPAARGFAAKYGVTAEKLEIKNTDKGEYFCVRKKIPGEKAEKLLGTALPAVIGKLFFPKTMVWEPSRFRFARPLRTLVALYGEKPIKFSLAGVKAANWTHGLHTLTRKKIVITAPERYLTLLRNNCVLADQHERRAVIEKIIEATAKRAKGTALADASLVDEVNYLVEHPVAVLCRFEERYLRLPEEVLVTCLKKKQKCFAVAGADGALTNSFIGIRNGVSENQDVVREGYERVLAARLADAEFFFQQDVRTPLSAKAEKLKGVNFQQDLGTVFDKTERVKQLALSLNDTLGVGLEPGTLEKAAVLSKADLVTAMVFEYPELQGVMGRIYAVHDAEPGSVARAIEEHYWPLTTEAKLPEGKAAIVLALADKTDTLVGDFAVGLIPSGSADPYGLRRLATGIVRIIDEKGLALSLHELVERSFSLFPEKIRAKNPKAAGQVLEFLRQRLENLGENEGFRFDEVRAALAAGFDSVVDLKKRLRALHEMRRHADFEALAIAFKRAANILKQAEKLNVAVPSSADEGLLKEDAERNLYAAVRTIEADVQSTVVKGEYRGALQKMVSIKPSVDEFFDKVMVMVDDESLKVNRLALLKYITQLFARILDFSLLQG